MKTADASMLYAKPDHQVMEALLPGIGDARLTVESALQALRERPGLVPIAVNPADGGWVYFADIGDTPLLEWKHIYTIERLARSGQIDYWFSTPVAILEREPPRPEPVPLQGLIFHVSRCGSTLFCKALARSERNLVVVQAGPLQDGFWKVLSNDWQQAPQPSPRNLTMLRNLVALLTRRRRADYQRAFIKFISWNSVYFDFIRAAFPDTPALFIYRDPVEVIAMILSETTAALRAKGSRQAGVMAGMAPAETGKMAPESYLAHCYANYFEVMLRHKGDDLSVVNFTTLRDPQALGPTIAEGFRLELDDAELSHMQEQYRLYSKDDSGQTTYQGEPEDLRHRLSGAQQAAINGVIGARLARLNDSTSNVSRRLVTF